MHSHSYSVGLPVRTSHAGVEIVSIGHSF